MPLRYGSLGLRVEVLATLPRSAALPKGRTKYPAAFADGAINGADQTHSRE